jgi:hypothetical protein
MNSDDNYPDRELTAADQYNLSGSKHRYADLGHSQLPGYGCSIRRIDGSTVGTFDDITRSDGLEGRA